MFNKSSNIKKIIPLFVLGGFLYPLRSICQEKFLLQENEMPGFRLEDQYPWMWVVGEGNIFHPTITQKWSVIGKGNEDIYISYGEFKTISECIQSIAYAATKSYSVPYIWGSLTGFIVGDGSWVGMPDALFFIRGNVGIQIFKPGTSHETEKQMLISISEKILNKIEANLSSEISAYEEALKQKQISSNDYHIIVEPVFGLDIMKAYSLHSTWDSKWVIDSNRVAMGIRSEWKNEQGSIIGIDICKFDSIVEAQKACEQMNKILSFLNHIVDLDNLSSFKTIIAESRQYGLERSISLVGSKDNFSLHLYLFDSTGIDTNLVFSLVEKITEGIGNF